jgi:hypothetical protein|tara:strand:- start:1763 stop:1951 length:189 start_codon:yes stop_codon:yes gene_type:complete
MAEVDFNQMNGMEVLGYLLMNEPALWGLLGLGVVAFIGSIIFDKWQDKEINCTHNDNYPPLP